MYGSKRVAVRDLNPHILCALCGGYLIQATTVIECLHSFCRSCIVNFLETSKVCPICDAQIHKTRPLLNIRPDQTLQSLVYKLVPGLFQDEMRRRREFHATLSESDVEDLTLEERGEASLEKEFKPGDDHVSLVLQLAFRKDKSEQFEVRDCRNLLCPSEVTVRQLKKFIRLKFQLGDGHKIEMYRSKEELTDDLMLQDIALIYSWRKEKPMHLYYTVTESPLPKKESKDVIKTTVLSANDKAVTFTEHPLPAMTVSASCPTTGSLASGTSLATATTSSLASSSSFLPVSVISTPATHVSTSSVATAKGNTVTHPAPVTCNNTHDKSSIEKVSKSTELSRPSQVNDKTGAIQPVRPAISMEEKVPTSRTTPVSASPTAGASTTKSANTKQDASKLMHSVQSILNKSPRKHKHASASLSWTPVPALHHTTNSSDPQSEGKTESGTEENKSLVGRDFSGQKEDNKNSQISDRLICSNTLTTPVVPSFRKSHSVIEDVIETSSEPIPLPAAAQSSHVSSERVSEDQPALDSTQQEDKDDVFSSYIPKFQKHRKLCAVKRSVSYEESPAMPVLVAASSGNGEAMEKRNWKKRKLSTLDFDSTKVSSAAEPPSIVTTTTTTNNNNNKTAVSNDIICQNHVTSLTCHPREGLRKAGQMIKQETSPGVSPGQHPWTQYPGSAFCHSRLSVPTTQAMPPSVSYLPFLLPTTGVVNTPSGKLTSCRPATKDTKPSSHQRDASQTVSMATANNNKTSCKSRYSSEATPGQNLERQACMGSKKQQVLSRCSEESQSSVVSEKSANRSGNKLGKCSGAYTHSGNAGVGKSVEEICVEISTSPSDVSSVTSPATDVTSPGTEDRTDNSALPEIQTSCDNNCVVNFHGKVVPLDLSSKKKK